MSVSDAVEMSPPNPALLICENGVRLANGEFVQVWQVNDCQWWAGAGPAALILDAFERANGGAIWPQLGKPEALSARQLDTYTVVGTSLSRDAAAPKPSFRHYLTYLVQQRASFPCPFASMDY